MPCLQPAFTLDYTKWSLLAGPGRAVGAVIVSSPAAGDLLQALPALLSAPCVVHLHQHTLPPREKGQGSTREQRGLCRRETPKSLFESLKLPGRETLFDLPGAQLCLFPATVTAPGNALPGSSPWHLTGEPGVFVGNGTLIMCF